MSRMRLSKKLKPAKKAWKNLSNNIQSKLHKLNIQKTFKTTLQHLLSLFHSFTHLITSKTTHNRFLTSSKSLYAPSTSYQIQHKKISSIQINDLYSHSRSVSLNSMNKRQSTTSTSTCAGTCTSTSNICRVQGQISREVEESHGDESNNCEINTIEDAWKAVVAKSPMMQVDQKAEEFIYKFRQDIRLQKEKSMIEFHERLARGT